MSSLLRGFFGGDDLSSSAPIGRYDEDEATPEKQDPRSGEAVGITLPISAGKESKQVQV